MDTWTATTPKRTVGYLALLRLDDGRVFVSGGLGAGGADVPRPVGDTEVYDPVQDRWRATAAAPASHARGAAIVLRDGRVLLTGGLFDARAADLYDVGTDSWIGAAAMREGRQGHQAVLLGDGSVLVLGGRGPLPVHSVERYDPGRNLWQPLRDLATERSGFTATRAADDRIVVVGGFASEHAAGSGEVYQPCAR